MTRRKEEFGLRLSAEESMEAALEAADLEGWRIKSRGEARIVCKQPWRLMSTAMPTKLKVDLGGDKPGITRVTLTGRKFGYGPLQSLPLRRQLESFRRNMETWSPGGARTASGPQESVGTEHTDLETR